MNTFEKILLDILKGGEIAAPIFIHSPGGIALLNASEEGLAALLAHFGKKMMTPATPLSGTPGMTRVG